MIKGVSKNKTYAYVCIEDRIHPSDEQTVFHLKAKTGHDTNLTIARYSQARETNKKGNAKIDPNKLTLADQEEFASLVVKIDNFQFPEDHQYYNDGKIYSDLSDPSMIAEIGKVLPAEIFAEILEAANSISALEEGVKKSSI